MSMISGLEGNPAVRGLQINYYFICRTKLWFFSHNIQMERESELVKLGRLLHEESYSREKKELIIDDLIAADFVKRKDCLEVHEVKKSNTMEEAHRFQLIYYLFYLKHVKGIENLKGFIDYPALKKRTEVSLNDEDVEELKNVIKDIDGIIRGPPPAPQRKPICRSCAYFELCWI
ncbi:CRISPR-associated protein Cas4 [Methanothermobacter sp. K4]|uniref:CRISPR-associated protein Cas4 n=1 Tax=Methanothermobacter sp. K4 TaxID=2913262 RepID=UPI001EDB9E57|nr:CRISPR-associated protein Cas4 [Methanothermobacter sp. K4]MCG2828249.1 CRISPR-associated protein Cas4 [Methanothermobacter sp. K4]